MNVLKVAVFAIMGFMYLTVSGCAAVAEGLMTGIGDGILQNINLDPFSEVKKGPETTVNHIQSFPAGKKISLASPIVVDKGMEVEKNNLADFEKDVMNRLYGGIRSSLSAKNLLAGKASKDTLQVEVMVHYVKDMRPRRVLEEYRFPSLYSGDKTVKRWVGGQVLVTRLIIKYKGVATTVLDFIDSIGTATPYQELTDPMSNLIINELSKLVDKGVNMRKTPLPYSL